MAQNFLPTTSVTVGVGCSNDRIVTALSKLLLLCFKNPLIPVKIEVKAMRPAYKQEVLIDQERLVL